MSHEQVWTKVNAQVDKGIAPLVEALSAFPELQTLSSCEGYQDRAATVSFRYGAPSPEAWRELSAFVFGFFGPKMAQKVGDSARVFVEVTTWGETLGGLSIRPGCVSDVAVAVSEMAEEFSQLRKKACSDGIPYTSPAGSTVDIDRQQSGGERPTVPERAA